MAAESLGILQADLTAVRFCALSSELCYLLGACQATVGLRPHVLIPFMKSVQRTRTDRELDDQQYLSLCQLLKEGRVGDAKEMLDQLKPLVPSVSSELQERMSIDLATRLEEQNKRELEMQIVCQRCNKPVQDIEPVHSCGHIFHQLCLMEGVSEKIKEGVYHITCPAKDCDAFVEVEEVKSLPHHLQRSALMNRECYLYYQSHPETAMLCPTAHCSNHFYLPSGIEYSCTSCNMKYCLRCRSALHPNRRCEDVKPYLSTGDLDNMMSLVRVGVVLRACPNCKVWILKPGNLKKLSCFCGTNFCAFCGSRGNCFCGRGPSN